MIVQAISKDRLNPQERKIVALAALGGMLEFYDFIIYGVFSVYFASQFFPSHNQWIVILQSYLVFALGYIARPIGGVIFSHIGDEYGRKKVLVITIVLMGLASLGIGFLPTYTQIGIAAPILLLVLRLTQGIALGGELPSTYVYISESIKTKQAVAFGVTMSGVNGGLLLGMLINYLLNHFLTTAQLSNFGWRIPFIIGGLACLISYRIRKTLQETTVFNKIHDKPTFPLVYFLRHHFSEFIRGTALIAVMSGFVVVIVVFMPTYLHDMLKYDNQRISYAMTFLMIVNVITIYITGRIARYFSPITVMKTLLFLSCALIPASYFFLYCAYIKTGLIVLGFLQGISAMVTPYLITTLFESKIRLTGVALCYNVGFTLFGGLAPLLITHSIHSGYGIYITPSVYLLCMVCICGMGLIRMKQPMKTKTI